MRQRVVEVCARLGSVAPHEGRRKHIVIACDRLGPTADDISRQTTVAPAALAYTEPGPASRAVDAAVRLADRLDLPVGADQRRTTTPDGRAGESQTRTCEPPMPQLLTLLRFVVPTVLAATFALPAPAAGGVRTVDGTDKMRAAEARLLKDINRIRVRNGRKPLRLDKRTRQVARARSVDMAAKRYFAHVEPDGDDADRILERRDISASEVTENIGHTVGLTLREGSKRMARWWYRSPPHRVQMLARDVNYVGIGIARRGGRFTYTAIFTRSRDKTEPRVVIVEAAWQRVTTVWRGHRLARRRSRAGDRHGRDQALRSRRFSVPDGWGDVDEDPRKSELAVPTPGTRDEHLRIRAVDKAGNVGPWAYTRLHKPERPSRRG